MRVATNTQFNDFLYNMGVSGTKMQKTMNQLASLKEVSQSSDNPLLVSKIMNLNVALDKNKTYNTEIKDSISWTDTQDSVLDGINNSMNRIRSLIQSSATATNGPDELAANKREMEQEVQSIVDALNTNFDGRYIFGGKNTTTPPFEVEKDASGAIRSIKYHGTNENLPRQIADGVSVDLVTDGTGFMDVVDETGTVTDNFNTFFQEVFTAINEEDKTKLSGDLMSRVDKLTNNFSNVRTKIGAVANRLKSAQDRNETEKLSLSSTLSERQDVDVAEKFMQYQNEYLAYQSTMAMGTKIMQTSILDYVR